MVLNYSFGWFGFVLWWFGCGMRRGWLVRGGLPVTFAIKKKKRFANGC